MEPLKVKDLLEPTFVKVKDILPGKSGYNLYMKVVEKRVLIDIVRIDKTRVVIADFIVGDETGIIKMRLRNELFVDIINEGETIIVRNCKVPIVNQHMRMHVDAFGKVEVSHNLKINDVKMDKDLSAVVYDHFTANRKKFNDNNNYYYQQQQQQGSVNDTQSVGTFLSAQVNH